MFCTSILDLDKAFDDIVDALRDSDFSYVVSSNMDGLKEINSFSKADVPYSQYVDEDKNLYFDFALAGISKDSIGITRTGRQIEIIVKASEEKNKFAYTHKGIKFPKNKDVSIATIDVTDKYNDSPVISFENGLLRVKFMLKPEEKPVELEIQ
jgi:HSP20 family molecular chaperone IbpA